MLLCFIAELIVKCVHLFKKTIMRLILTKAICAYR
jgi:hypothetical protein